MRSAHRQLRDVAVRHRIVVVLGELVQTTAGKWITHPPTRCPNGHPLGPNQVLVGHQACLGHAAATPPGPAAHATRRCTGHRSTPLHHPQRACDRGISTWRSGLDPHGWRADHI